MNHIGLQSLTRNVSNEKSIWAEILSRLRPATSLVYVSLQLAVVCLYYQFRELLECSKDFYAQRFASNVIQFAASSIILAHVSQTLISGSFRWRYQLLLGTILTCVLLIMTFGLFITAIYGASPVGSTFLQQYDAWYYSLPRKFSEIIEGIALGCVILLLILDVRALKHSRNDSDTDSELKQPWTMPNSNSFHIANRLQQPPAVVLNNQRSPIFPPSSNSGTESATRVLHVNKATGRIVASVEEGGVEF